MIKGKHAVVTGAGSGIGATIAKTLAAKGAKLSLMGRRLDALETTRLSFTPSEQANTQCISCDVSDSDSTSEAFAAAISTFGTVDILVNNAGAAPSKPFHKISTTDWRQVMAVNLDGVFNCTSEVIDAMRSNESGRVINIASTASLVGYAYVSAYCTAKHGVLGLTRALALETATKNITVNAICPGYADTEIIQASVKNIIKKTGRSEEQALKQFTQTNPQGRLIDPQEVADTVIWLCSNSSRSITGQAISLSGGEVM